MTKFNFFDLSIKRSFVDKTEDLFVWMDNVLLKAENIRFFMDADHF